MQVKRSKRQRARESEDGSRKERSAETSRLRARRVIHLEMRREVKKKEENKLKEEEKASWMEMRSSGG